MTKGEIGMQEQDLDQISVVIKNVVNEAIENFGKRLKPEIPIIKRVELLLWNREAFYNLVLEKELQIKEAMKSGVPHESPSITEYTAKTGVVSGISLEEDIVEQVIENLQRDIIWINSILVNLDLALKSIANEPYYKMLTDYYFDGASLEKTAAQYNLDITTASRVKKELLNKLAVQLFTKEYITDKIGELE